MRATTDAIGAIRSVRLAAHELENACRSIVGGTQMAVSLPTVDTIGKSTRGLTPKPLGKRPMGGE
jgi:hypothetical protein